MNLAFESPELRTLTIAGRSERFAVNRVFCVGRNYAAHAREMGKDPERDPPFFFMKPASAVVDAAAAIELPYPPRTSNYHHEVELVVAIGRGGRDISGEIAHDHVYGYAVGLDMTRRDLQLQARDQGRPWEFGKSFSRSAPIGVIRRVADHGHPSTASITLSVNDQIRQSSNISKLIWSVAECITYLSQFEALEAGDLIMTGTPDGVGAVVAGDRMRGSIAGFGDIDVLVTP